MPIDPNAKMPAKYVLGWLAGLWIFGGSGIARNPAATLTGTVISVILLTAIAYGLACHGWRRGWFRKG